MQPQQTKLDKVCIAFQPPFYDPITSALYGCHYQPRHHRNHARAIKPEEISSDRKSNNQWGIKVNFEFDLAYYSLYANVMSSCDILKYHKFPLS
jgi:hypothetical protein